MIDLIFVLIICLISIKIFLNQISTPYSALFINTRKIDSLEDVIDKIDYANNFYDKQNKIIFTIVQAMVLTLFISLLVYENFNTKKIITLFFINFILIFVSNNFLRHHFYNRIHYYTDKNIKKLRTILKTENKKIPIGRDSPSTNPDYYTYKYMDD